MIGISFFIKFSIFLILIFLSILEAQSPQKASETTMASQGNTQETIRSRFPTPPGFSRVEVEAGSYGAYLRSLPLLPINSPVKDYRGRIWKSAEDTSVAAVVDWDIAGGKLEQCMDIIIRLRAEYLLESGKADEIVFLMPDRSELKWRDWKTGLRPVQSGWSFPLQLLAKPDDSRQAFEGYLNCIFNYSDTQTYYFGLDTVDVQDIQIGDFIVKRGKKGHAVVIVDLAMDKDGNRVALFAQGDTPACQLYLLSYRKNNPWVPLNFSKEAVPLPIRKTMTWDGLRHFH